MLVSTHGRSHLDVLLPSLEEGLFDDNWRIRQSSVQLLGDLLYLVGGTKASDQSFMAGADDDDDENEGVEIYEGNATLNAARAMAAVLGMERRNAILATLYLLRSDTSSGVRQCALQVWKTMVPNTPRTVREILPVVVAQVVEALASGNLDKRTVAGRALGDVVKKLGESVLTELVPILRRGLDEGNDANARQGVCLGLSEVSQKKKRERRKEGKGGSRKGSMKKETQEQEQPTNTKGTILICDEPSNAKPIYYLLIQY